MSRYDTQVIAELVSMIQETLTAAGFTGVKLERAPMSDAVVEVFREENPDEDIDPEEFGEETHYHRVTTDQGSFGIWFEPYVTLDLHGTGIDTKELLPTAASADLPEGWSLIGLDEEVPEKLFSALTKKSRQP